MRFYIIVGIKHEMQRLKVFSNSTLKFPEKIEIKIENKGGARFSMPSIFFQECCHFQKSVLEDILGHKSNENKITRLPRHIHSKVIILQLQFIQSGLNGIL